MKKGFVLIEALLALAMASTVFTSLYILQGSVVRHVGLVSGEFSRILLAKQQWFQLQYSDKKNSKKSSEIQGSILLKQEIAYPQTTITITKKSVSSKSSLASINGLHAEWITTSWQSNGKIITQNMILFVDESEL